MTAHTLPAQAGTVDHVGMMLALVRNGDFTGVPLNYLGKLDWIDLAQWYHDVRDEPEDVAQVLSEARLALVKSDYRERWDRLPEREQDAWAGCFESWFDNLLFPEGLAA